MLNPIESPNQILYWKTLLKFENDFSYYFTVSHSSLNNTFVVVLNRLFKSNGWNVIDHIVSSYFDANRWFFWNSMSSEINSMLSGQTTDF